jgi:hypothetical protein
MCGSMASSEAWHLELLDTATSQTQGMVHSVCAGDGRIVDFGHSIQTWALEEARRRLEAEGILEDPDKKASAGGAAVRTGMQ